jgi:hypothetical protein
MFARKPRNAARVPFVAECPGLEYYAPPADSGSAPRPMTALDQMFAYYEAE